MKKLTVFLVFFVFVMTILVTHLESMSVSPWGGYANLDMKEANEYVESEAVDHGATEVITVENGYVAGIDIGMFRFGYLSTLPGGYSYISGVETEKEYKSLLSMVLIGVRMPHPSRSIINIGIYGGYADVSISEIEIEKMGSMEIKKEIPYIGSNIMTEAVFGLKFGLFELDVSYRYAIIKEVKVAQDVDFDDGTEYKKDTVLVDKDGDPVVFDYSGVTVSLGLRFGPGPEAIVEDFIQGSIR